MTDKEMLELAAKAAGITIGWKNNIPYTGMGSYMPIAWNPLFDDGDALRLAVKLSMQLDISASGCLVYLSNSEAPIGTCAYSETRDIEAATRRAIVRAAAEIGKRGEQK
jgi:hypothetical protein